MITKYTIKCDVTVDDSGKKLRDVLPQLDQQICRNVMRAFYSQPTDTRIVDAVQNLLNSLAALDNAGEVIISLLLYGLDAAHILAEKESMEAQVMELLATLTHTEGGVQ